MIHAPTYTCCDCQRKGADVALIRVLDTGGIPGPVWHLYGCAACFPLLVRPAASADPLPPLTLAF